MKFFLIITIFSIFMLAYWDQNPEGLTSSKVSLPVWMQEMRPSFDKSFKEGMHAKLLWSLLTGEKRSISPAFSKAMNTLQLGFLLSFTSIQLSVFGWGLEKAFKKTGRKKIKNTLRSLLIAAPLFMPYLSLQRLAFMRILKSINRKFHFYKGPEFIIACTFILSFALGHYTQSPLGFIFSLLFIGCFTACESATKKEITLCLISNHLILALYFHRKYYLLSVLVSILILPLSFCIISLGYIYLLSYQWIDFNWIEFLVSSYMNTIKHLAKSISWSEINPSFAWFMMIWMILLKIPARYFLPLSIVSIAANVCW